jgi:hypothetical protein
MAPKKKNSPREIIKHIIRIVLPIFSTLFLIGTTALIIVIMKGYSVDITKREIIKTGVISVETDPRDVQISIDGQDYGTSNRAIPNIKVGTYEVTLKKEGYFSFNRKLMVEHGLATPLVVPLISDTSAQLLDLEETTRATVKNDTGYYVLNEKTNKNVGTPKTYTITRYHIVKPLFDQAQVATDESMNITALSTTPIIDFTVSDTGKHFLITYGDQTTSLSTALISFKKGSNVNLNLSSNAVLTTYAQDKNNKLYWSQNGDYILVETQRQLISYNIKTGTRVILTEKNTTKNAPPLIWTQQNDGITVLRSIVGEKTPLYEIIDISYNGNPMPTTYPSLLLEEVQPKNIWTIGDKEQPMIIVSTDKGSYLLGKLFNNKISNLVLNSTSEIIDELPITHFQDNYSLIPFTKHSITTKPIFSPLHHAVFYKDNEHKRVLAFTFNKRPHEQLLQLGEHEIIRVEEKIHTLSMLNSEAYLLLISENDLIAADVEGQNTYILNTEANSIYLAPDDSALLIKHADNALSFRIIR